jgi:hypothetical protein
LSKLELQESLILSTQEANTSHVVYGVNTRLISPPESIPIEHDPEEMVTILQKALFKNIEIIGNCLGTTEDLANGISSYTAGKYDVIVDSTYSGKEVDKFLQRTYVDKDRIGKVVFCYDR